MMKFSLTYSKVRGIRLECSVKYAWSVLHFAARISAEKQLPVILDG
jgi:hypothetical protein